MSEVGKFIRHFYAYSPNLLGTYSGLSYLCIYLSIYHLFFNGGRAPRCHQETAEPSPPVLKSGKVRG